MDAKRDVLGSYRLLLTQILLTHMNFQDKTVSKSQYEHKASWRTINIKD